MHDNEHTHLIEIASAFIFMIRSETYAVNRAALVIQSEVDRDFADLDHPVVWEAAYSVLMHSGNLSKIFWPAPNNRYVSPALADEIRTRGTVLRQLFDVNENSPLRNRDVRNGFEHLDEYIHTELARQPGRSVVDQYIGHIDDQAHPSQKITLRSFDHRTSIVTAGQKEIALIPLIRESDRLYDRWRKLEGLPPQSAG